MNKIAYNKIKELESQIKHLLEVNKRQAENFAKQKQLVKILLTKLDERDELIKKLQGHLAKNSSNSSKSPSSDGLSKKKKPKSLRKKNNQRKLGGQPGHKGSTLGMKANPNHESGIQVDFCACGHNLRNEPVERVERRQVYDIPAVRVEVTEYQAEVKACPACGQETMGVFPKGVDAPVQYGDYVRAVASYIMNFQMIPFKRASQFLENIYGVSISEGTLANIRKEFAENVTDPVERIKELIAIAELVHFDETGFRAMGKRIYLHVAATLKATYFACREGRGFEAMKSIGILSKFVGKAVHDHHRSYYLFNCVHAECLAHILRELIFLHEERGQKWADDLIKHFLDVKKLVEKFKEAGKTSFTKAELRKIEDRYDEIIADGRLANPPPKTKKNIPKKRGRKANPPEINMLNRLEEFKKETLRFAHDFKVPFDNNLAERDLRPEKTREKISGTTRGKDSADEICKIRSYISTAKKNMVNIFEAITMAFNGEPFVPESA
jgi:transposase